eukprot:TRINITY_DN6689_c0_g1_i1.p1 TRINITY_DN6689_c0_g1~~TRINITY_DN6689_c0_g1_i1.p1  ORF type:complete len:1151 (+),score=275.62 TRINITY_DN6689_c0_g1_i1:39-3455(+)
MYAKGFSYETKVQGKDKVATVKSKPMPPHPDRKPKSAPTPKMVEVRSEEPVIENTNSAGLLPFIALLCSCVRTASKPETKLIGLELLFEFAKYVDDESKLGRIVPYFVSMSIANEKQRNSVPTPAIVRASAIRLLTETLYGIQDIPNTDAKIFPAYVFSSLSRIPFDEEEIVKVTYAQNLAKLAETSRRFLDVSSFAKPVSSSQGLGLGQEGLESSFASESSPFLKMYPGSYDKDLAQLHSLVWSVVQEIMDKDSSKVKIALLSDITRLSVFFGREKVNGKLLPLSITVLNDKDWQARAAFFENIIGVGIFVGQISLREFILPCIEDALADVEEYVIFRALQSLTAFCQLNLLENYKLEALSSKVCPLLCHPSSWIRRAALKFVVSVAEHLGPAKSHCYLCPKLRRLVTEELYNVNELTLLQSLKHPLSRTAFNRALRIRSNENEAKTGSNSDNLLTQSDEDLLLLLQPHIDTISRKLNQYDAANQRNEEEIQQKFLNISREVSLHRVNLPHTLPTNVWQDLFADFKEKEYPNSFSVQSSTFARPKASAYNAVLENLWLRFAQEPDFAIDLYSKTPIDEKVKDLPHDVKRALDIPPELPDIGTKYLEHHHLTRSPFYRNHRPPYTYDIPEDKKPSNWTPRGVLVADLGEHKASVNRVSVSRDNVFFVSASDDGTVKIWDSQKLEKALGSSQLTYSSQGGKILDVVVCDCSHSFASVSSNGTIHVVKTSFTFKKDDKTHEKYLGNSTVKNLAPEEGAALCIDHFNSVTESLLVYSTQKGNVHFWDLRASREPFVLSVPPYVGVVTQLSVGPTQYCLVGGTSRGYIIVWDLRFQVPVQIWRHSSKSRITHISSTEAETLIPASPISHPTTGPLLFVSAMGANEVCAFDIYTGEARECFRVQNSKSNSQVRSTPKHLNSSPLSTPKPRISITENKEYALRANPLAVASLYPYLSKDLTGQPLPQDYLDVTSEFSLLMDDRPHMSGMMFHEKDFVLTVGSDAVVRFWNLQVDKEELRPSRRLSSSRDDLIDGHLFYKAHLEGSTAMFEEIVSRDNFDFAANIVTPEEKMSEQLRNSAVMGSVRMTTSAQTANNARSLRAGRARGPTEPPSHHTDAITDLKAFEYPQKMLITSSRNGRIKVWV